MIYRKFFTVASEYVIENSLRVFLEIIESEIIKSKPFSDKPKAVSLFEKDELEKLAEDTKELHIISIILGFQRQRRDFYFQAQHTQIKSYLLLNPIDWTANESVMIAVFLSGVELEKKLP